MATRVTNYLKDKFGDTLRNQSFAVANLYVALLTTMPTDDDMASLVEASGSGYARAAVTLEAFVNGLSSNGITVQFSASGGDLTGLLGWALYDASSVGNALITKDFPSTQSITDGTTKEFAIGAIDLTIAAA